MPQAERRTASSFRRPTSASLYFVHRLPSPSVFRSVCNDAYYRKLFAISLSLSLTFSFPPYALSLSRSLGPLRKHELLQEKRCDSDDGTRAVGILKALAHVVSLAGCILEGCCSPRKDWQFGYDWDKSCRSSLRGEIGLCPGAGAACATHAVVFCLQTCKLQAVLEMEQSRSRLSAAEAALAQKGKVRDGSRRVAPGSG